MRMKERKEKKRRGKKKKKRRGKEGKKEWGEIRNLKRVEKTVKVKLFIGRRKRKELKRAQREGTKVANEMARLIEPKDSYRSFHARVYHEFRYRGFHSQVQEAIQRRVFALKKVALRKNAKGKKLFNVLPLEFNFPRSAKIALSKRGNPLLFVSPYKKRIALPIVADGAYERLEGLIREGWSLKSCILYNRHGHWTAHIVLSIKTPAYYTPQGTVGVDLGEVVLAAVTLNNPSFPLIESYNGKDLLYKSEYYSRRRADLQSAIDRGVTHDARRAKKTIKNLWLKEKHFLRTRCEQVARDIVYLAYSTCSAVVVEDLRHLNRRFTKHSHPKLPRSLRRRLHRWLYGYFYRFLQRLCSLYGVPFVVVPPTFSSQVCSRCGRRTKSARHGRLYHCPYCSLKLHSDRNASRNLSYLGLIVLSLPLFSSWFFYPHLTFPCERTARSVQFPRWGALGPPLRRHDRVSS